MENFNDSISLIEDFFAVLVGKVCWAATAGFGSMVSLKFGEKILRPRPISNPNLPEDVRNFDAEFVVFVDGGARWTINNGDVVVCTNDDNNERGGPMDLGVNLLVGKRLLSVHLAKDYLVLTLNFDDDLCLQLRCRIKGMTGYFLLHKGREVATVGGDKHLDPR